MATKTKEELDDAAAKEQARAEGIAEAEANKMDETVPGGDYIVDGRHVNADGEELKKK